VTITEITFDAPISAEPAPEPAIPDAPWGLNARGVPYKRDPATYASRTKRGRATSGTGPKAPTRKATANRPATGPAVTQARAKAIFDLLSIPISGLALVGQTTGNLPLLADACVLSTAAPQLAEATAAVAAEHQGVAKVVDRLVQTGPWAALLTACLPVAVQLASNHAPTIKDSVGKMFNASSVEEIISAAGFEADEAAAAAQAAWDAAEEAADGRSFS
jgi:hypothetical protein